MVPGKLSGFSPLAFMVEVVKWVKTSHPLSFAGIPFRCLKANQG